MKTKLLVILTSLLLLNSCLLRSLHPFYTGKTIVFDTSFLGKWIDNSSAQWKVTALKDDILDGKSFDSLSKKDFKFLRSVDNFIS